MPLAPLLVSYDGSYFSAAAASFARTLASARGLASWLVQVAPPHGALPAAEQEALAGEALRFTTPVTVAVLAGNPVEALVAEAEHLDAGLVVMGTRSRSPVTGVLLGSTTRGVLRACPRPVVVVHRPVAAVTRVLVGVDASPRSLEVTTVAAEVARALGAEIVLVHAVDADPVLARDPEAYGITPESWDASLAAKRERVFGPVRGVCGHPVRERLVFGLAVERLREAAAEEGAELVAVGRVGSSGRSTDDWLSVAYALAIRGPFAALVV